MENFNWWKRLNPFQKRKSEFDPTQFPDWYQTYADMFQSPDENAVLGEVNFTVFDTETTGLNPQTDRMLSIGAVKVSRNTLQITSSFQRFLNPELARRRTKAVPVHGLLPDSTWREYVTEERALRDFLAFIGSDVLVAHHLRFDLAVIETGLARLGGGTLKNVGIDTVNVAKKLQPAGYWSPDDAYTLDHLARRYAISLSDRHTSLGDSYITAILLLKLSNRLAERKGRPLMLSDLR